MTSTNETLTTLHKGHFLVSPICYNGADYRSVFTDTQYETALGGDNLRYREDIALGLNATNSYSRVIHEKNEASYTLSYDFPYPVSDCVTDGSVNVYEESPLLPVFPPHAYIDLSTQASGKLLDRLREHRQQFSSGVFIGELRETIRMIRSPLKTLRRSIDLYRSDAEKIRRGVRSVNRVGRKKMTQALVDSYLEYSFGWSPLIGDIADGVKAYDAITQSQRARRKRLRATKRGTAAVPPVTFESEPYALIHDKTVTGQVIKMSLGLVEEVSYLRTVGDSIGLNPFENFLPDLYNILPWTFLIDYFSNLGSVIEQSCTSVQGVAWVSRTSVTTTTFQRQAALDAARFAASGHLMRNFTSSRLVTKTTTIDRQALSPEDLRASKLTFHLPGSRARLNIAALISARALRH